MSLSVKSHETRMYVCLTEWSHIKIAQKHAAHAFASGPPRFLAANDPDF